MNTTTKHKPISPDELDAIDAEEASISKGPWCVFSDEGPIWMPNGRSIPRECLDGWQMSICHDEDFSREKGKHVCVATFVMREERDPQGLANGKFLAESRTRVPRLSAEVRRLRAALETLATTDGSDCARFGSGGAPMLAGFVRDFARKVLDARAEPEADNVPEQA